MADTKTSVVIQARVDGLASVKGLESGLTNLGNTADKTGGKFAKFNGLLRGLSGAIAAAGLTRILGNAAEVAAGFESETLLLKQGLQNVGATTGELERLQGVADELGKATLFNEEDFRQGFGLLTSFGNIATENYDRVAIAAANVAQVSGTDISSSFMQLAKALNDPVKGLTALSRSGIQFTEDQKTMIQSMVEAGNTAGAQEMILKELDAQYGNTAVAAAGGAAGVKDTFGEAMYDLNVAVGRVANEVMPPFLAALTEIINAFTGMPQPVQAAIIAIGGIAALATLLAPVVSTIGSLIGLLTGGGGLAAAIAAVFSGPVGWVALLVAAGVAIYTFRDQIGGALKAIGQFFIDGFKFIGDILKIAAQAYLDFYVKPVLGFAQDAWDGIVDIFNRLPDAIKAPFIAAGRMIQSVWNSILTFVANSLNSFIQKVNAAINLVSKLPNINIPNIPTVQGPQQAPSFAGGGYTGDAPRVGGIDGKGGFPAILHPRERVIDLTARNGNVAMQPAQINIQTGPVMQADGQNWVTVADLQRAMRATEAATIARLRTYAGRRAVGVA
ncbi:MAG: hypothetical protein EBZ29_08740 [Synechococcaceae bacterium WB9_4xC_028]|nr:hypothetical protein [Synechococcaceae bacterium WB9_4xB_025]NDD69457.1 hypothetical protein [Synechococcaceae bacterium WB9_4xC_028]